MKEKDFLLEKIEKLSKDIEKMKIAEYVKLMESPWRLLKINFIAGVVRGLGMAVGFTIISAIVIYVLQRIALLNLPFISDIIADIVRMVREQSF